MYALALIILVAAIGYVLAKQRAVALAGGKLSSLHSRPGHHAWFVALLAAGPALALWAAWTIFERFVLGWAVQRSLPPDILGQSPEMLSFFMAATRRLAAGLPPAGEVTAELRAAADYYGSLQSYARVALVLACGLGALLLTREGLAAISAELRARNTVERWITGLLWTAAAVSILTTVGIVFSVLFESIRFFEKVPVFDFLFGLHWSPQTALRADQAGASGSFGAVPLFAGTLMITLIAIMVAGPIGLFSAIFLSTYASHGFRAVAKPILEVLAGVPTVVFGFFAALVVAPAVKSAGTAIGLDVASESALAAGLVMGIMIIPFISSLSDDAINSVPQSLRDASYGLGATRAETVVQVVIPAALPGIVAGFLLAISRAIGETMIVVMAAGLTGNLTANPLDSVTTVTVQIVTLLIGDQEFDSAKTLSAFALGLVLFVATLLLNIVALFVMRTYREKYD